MIRFNEKSFFSTLIFLFALVLLVDTADMRSDVALVPRIVGVALLLFAGLQMLNDLFPSFAEKIPWFRFLNRSLSADESIGGEGVVEETGSKEELKRRYLFVGWIVLFILLIKFTSVIWAIAVSMLIYLKWIAKEGWKMAVLYPLGMALVIYLAFVVVMDVYYFL
ncbi:hypothetical protein BSNK01_28100 [Bacillaceae bacterium]